MDEQTPLQMDAIFEKHFVRQSETLTHALQTSQDSGLPPIQVSAAQGKFLNLLTSIMGAKRILEIGTLGGYSAICMASALPEDGKMLSLEFEPHHADVARKNFEHAGLADKIEVRVGAGLDLLPAVEGTFDLIFVDANKNDNPGYFAHAVRLSHLGTIIIVDNVVRGGAVADEENLEPDQVGIREMFKLIAAEPRVDATAIQTVGAKGYDGFAFLRVTH